MEGVRGVVACGSIVGGNEERLYSYGMAEGYRVGRPQRRCVCVWTSVWLGLSPLLPCPRGAVV